MASKKPVVQPTSTALAVLSDHKLAVTDDRGRPYLQIRFELNPEGGENNSDVRLTLPRMKLLQAGSDEVKAKMKGATSGVYYNAATNELQEQFEAVLLYIFQERYYNFPKMSNNMICTSRDGRGMYGTCMRGTYSDHRIPSKVVEYEGREIEVGLCDRCPHSARAFGAVSDCQHSKILVMVPYEFIQQWQEILPRIEAGESDTGLISDIINTMFTFGFRSTAMKALNSITDQTTRDMSYFKWSWMFSTTPVSNDKGSWDAVTVMKSNKLTEDETVFARSLYKLAQRIRPVITDVDVVPDAQKSETPVGDDM